MRRNVGRTRQSDRKRHEGQTFVFGYPQLIEKPAICECSPEVSRQPIGYLTGRGERASRQASRPAVVSEREEDANLVTRGRRRQRFCSTVPRLSRREGQNDVREGQNDAREGRNDARVSRRVKPSFFVLSATD